MRRKRGQFAVMNDVPVILDLGHYALKGIVGDDENRRAAIRHGILEMSRDDWRNIVDAGSLLHPDYVRVGNGYYEIGQTALNHSGAPTIEGIDRYRRDYYGVLMCAMIARLFDPGEIQSAVVFASYPPGDRRHKDDLELALLGEWDFEHQGRTFHIIVRRVVTYAEPMGGFWNFVLLEDAQGQYDNPEYNPKRQTLMIDLGGGTMSLLPIGVDHLPDYRRSYSFPVGFNNVAEWFEREMRATYRDEFRGSRNLPDDLVHEALATGRWHGAGNDRGMDVSREVENAMLELVEQFRTGYHKADGPQPYGQIILTGGGSAILGERIKKLSGHRRVFYAHNDLSDMHFANVFGGLKAYREIFSEVMK
jgi:hypothetical protein